MIDIDNEKTTSLITQNGITQNDQKWFIVSYNISFLSAHLIYMTRTQFHETRSRYFFNNLNPRDVDQLYLSVSVNVLSVTSV